MPKVTTGGPSNAWEPGEPGAAVMAGTAAEAAASAGGPEAPFADDPVTEAAREAHVEVADGEPPADVPEAAAEPEAPATGAKRAKTGPAAEA